MARPIYEGANVATTDTFSQWLNRTNQIVYDMSTTVVTVAPYPQPNTINGAWTIDNGQIKGIFSGTSLVASSELRGGTVSNTGNLTITSNTIFNQSQTVHIQPNTANFTVNANTSLFTGNFEMSNLSKTFVVSANTTTIGGGPVAITANTTMTGSNVFISGTNTMITSNTTITANNTVLNSNLSANGTTTTIRSANTFLGENATSTVYIRGKVGQSVIPTGPTVLLGNTTFYYGNTYVGTVAANGDVYVSGNIRGGTHATSGNLDVTSNVMFTQSATIHVQPNTSLMHIQASNTTIGGAGLTYANTTGVFTISAATQTTSLTGISTLNSLTRRVNSNTVVISSNTFSLNSGVSTTITSPTQTATGTTKSDTFTTVTVSASGSEIHNTPVFSTVSGTINLGDSANTAGVINFLNTISTDIIPTANVTYDIGNANSQYHTVFTGNLQAATIVNSKGIITATGNIVTSTGNLVSTVGNVDVGNTAILKALLTNGIAHIAADKRVVTNSNFNYANSVLNVMRANDTDLAINTNASADISGNVVIGKGASVGENLTVAANTTTNKLTVSTIPTSRVPYTTTGGALTSTTNMSYDGTLFRLNATNNNTVIAEISGSANVAGTFLVTGATTLNSTLDVSGAANTNTMRVRSLSTGNALVMTGNNTNGDLGVNAGLTYNGALVISSNNTIGESIVASGGLTVSGNTSFAQGMYVAGSTEILGDLVVRGTTTLSSNIQLATNAAEFSYLTVGPELIMSTSTRLVGSFIPKTNNVYDLGMANSQYRTVYANNFIGNIAWANVTSKPSPTITLTGAVTGTGTMSSLGNVSFATTAVVANATASGVVSTTAQTFAGVKTFSGGITATVTGNASTATKLQSPVTINATSFDGSANITIPTRVVRSDANTTVPVAFVNDTYVNTANGAIKDLGIVDALSYNLATGTLISVDFNSSSDQRWKDNVETIDNALDLVKQMRGVRYDRNDTGETHVGVIAQEMEKVVPEVVNEDDEGYKYVSYGNLVGVLIEAVKEMSGKIEELEKEISTLKGDK